MSGKDEQPSSLEGHWVLPQVSPALRPFLCPGCTQQAASLKQHGRSCPAMSTFWIHLSGLWGHPSVHQLLPFGFGWLSNVS